MTSEQRTDAQLLAATGFEPEAFGLFYRRHVRAVLAYTLSRTRRPELAADLTAEVFASALEQHDRFDARRGPARAWLLTMASSKLVDAARRGQVEDRARRRLRIAPRELTDHDLERVEELADVARGVDVSALVDDLPADQRDAVLARIVDERGYEEIAAQMRTSPSVVRQRVSRGLSAMRKRTEKPA
ncbi:MAG TPA: sigma-70 family RNA polymerase sigma factor [Solirubrobacteraceae bacterium]|jgi:RNA polymerase sigma factor (sigma-70 family)